MTETPSSGWKVGDEANGYRWNGTSWDRIYKPGQIVNGHVFNGQTWDPLPPTPWWRRTSTLIVAGIIVVSILLLYSAVTNTVRDSSSARNSTASQDRSWAPSGFQYFPGDPSLAYSFSAPESKQGRCGYGDQCAKFAVVSQESCSSGIYVAISVLNAGGTVVDSSNEITGGVAARQVAAVAIPLFDSPGSDFKVTEMNCLG